MALDGREFELAQQTSTLDIPQALQRPAPERVYTPQYPLLANNIAPGVPITPSYIVASLQQSYPGVGIERATPEEVVFTYSCRTQAVAVKLDASGVPHAELVWRQTLRRVTMDQSGIRMVETEDADPTPLDYNLRSGGVVYEPYSDAATGATHFIDPNGDTYVLPGGMRTFIRRPDGAESVMHMQNRAYAPQLGDSTYSEWLSQRQRELNLVRNSLFPGEASPAGVALAIADARTMAAQNSGDIEVIDLPGGYTVVVQQFARNGGIWTYHYVVGPDNRTTHYTYARSELFADPHAQEQDERDAGVEYSFTYNFDPAVGGIVLAHSRRRTKAIDADGNYVDEIREDDITPVVVELRHRGAFVVSNVQRTTTEGGERTFENFDFNEHVVEALDPDPKHITFVQTQSVWEVRKNPARVKHKGEQFERHYHIGFIPEHDLVIPLIVVETPNGLRCQPNPKKKPYLVSAQTRQP